MLEKRRLVFDEGFERLGVFCRCLQWGVCYFVSR